MAIKTIAFDSNTTPNSKPNFAKGSDTKGLNYYNSYVPLKFYTKDYGYVIINITFTGNAQYAGVSFFSSQGSTFSISDNGIDNLFVPFIGGELDGYDLKLTPGVTKTVYMIINGDDTNITNQIQVNAAIGIKSGKSPIGNNIIIETNCVVNPLYKYNTGLHSYSPYDSIYSPKLDTYLYSTYQVSGWTIGTRVWSTATFDMPAVQYYYGYGNYVYKVGGPIDRSYGTKEKYEVIQTLWRSIWGKKPIVNKIDSSPRAYYNSSDNTIDACVNVILTDAGIITDIIDKFILPQPTKYKYYMGYDASNKQLSNDNFFAKYVFGQSKFYPITGLQHLMYKLITGYIRSTNFNLDANGQLGPLLAFGLPLALGALAAALPELNAFISSIFITGGPFGEWMYGLLTGVAGGASAFAILGLIGLVIGVIWALTKKIRKTLEEDCKKFLIEYTTTPYIELSNPLSRTSNMATINNGYFCDGVYFYTQAGSVITVKELSSTNALISEDPIRSQFQYSLAADDPTTVVQINKLLLLCYTSGIPIEFGTGTTYFSSAINTTILISDCSELVITPSSVNYTLPYGYIMSYVSQLDADTRANAVLASVSTQVSNSFNYSQMLSERDLGIIDSYFTHEIRVETDPNSVNCYFNNIDQSGLTIGKKLYYDQLGRHKVMNGFYTTEDSFYYRIFYKIYNGYVVDIYTMLNAGSTTVIGTSGSLPVITTNLGYTSNWYFYSLSQPDIVIKVNGINTQKCFDPNTLYSDPYVVRGYYDSGNTFYLYDDNYTGITMTEAGAGYYKPLTDWLTEPIFSYYPSLTINIDIEQICLPVSGYMNALFGFNIIGSLDGYITPLFNTVNLTIDVYVDNIIKATYIVNTSPLAKTYVSYDGAISPGDNVTSIQINSINSLMPINRISYNIGSYKTCNKTIANLSQTVLSDFSSGVTLMYTLTLDHAAASNVVFQIQHTNAYNSGTTITNVTIFSGSTFGAFNFTYYRQSSNYNANANFYAPTLPAGYIIGTDYLSYIIIGIQTCFSIESQITAESTSTLWCSSLSKVAYILTADTNSINTATKLYSGFDCITYAGAGYYGVYQSSNWRYWNGTAFTSSGTCPPTTTTTTTLPIGTTTTTTSTTTTTAAPIVLPSTNHIVGNQITKVVLSDNGEYLYLTRTNNTYHYVEQYTLTTPYFIASRVITPYGYVFTNLGTNDQLDSIDCFSPNGQYVYTTNQLKITRYELGTPWIMSTLITSSKQSYNTNQYLYTASAISMSFSSNGLYVSVSSVKNGYGRIYVFSLPTAWSFVGITYHSVGILARYDGINGFEFSVDGTKMYIMNSFNVAKIVEYNVVGEPFLPVLNQTISNSYDFTSQMDTTALSRDFCLSSNKQYAYILSLPTLTVQSLVQFNIGVVPTTTTTTTLPPVTTTTTTTSPMSNILLGTTSYSSGDTLAKSYDFGLTISGLGNTYFGSETDYFSYCGGILFGSGWDIDFIETQFKYSLDSGLTWTDVPTTIYEPLNNNQVEAVAYNGSIFVAAIDGGSNTLAYSYDGLTWSGLSNTIFSSEGRHVMWDGNKFIAGGDGTSNILAYSYDGLTWSGLGYTALMLTVNNITYNFDNGSPKYVAVGNSPTKPNCIIYSTDGLSWFGAGLPTFTYAGTDVIYVNSLFVGVGLPFSAGFAMGYSSDGINWTPTLAVSANTYIYAIAWTGDRYLIGGYGPSSALLKYSYDLNTFYDVTTTTEGVGCIITFGSSSPVVTTTTTTSATRYVGETYGGGIVAYVYQPGDPGYIVSEEHGIISNTVDLSTGLQWGGYGTSIGTTSLLLNEGGNNTNEIVATLGAGSYAAKLCASSTDGGYSDWKLPSLYELRKLHANQSLINGFTQISGVNYWSSSEHSSTQAWLKNFGPAGDESAANKQVGWTRIRAIRYF